MKIYRLVTFLVGMLLMTSLTAQDQPPIAMLSFMNAEDYGDYLEVEKNYWKPVHQKLVDDGKMLGWYVYEVASPYDKERGYTHITINVLPNWDSMEQGYGDMMALMKSVHPNKSPSDIFEHTEKSREMVRQEYWVNVDVLRSEDFNTSNVEYIVIDWMDVHAGHGQDYRQMELDVYKPVHQLRVDEGHILSWGLYQRLGHYSDRGGYASAATVATYADWSDLWNSYPENAFEKAHPGKNQQEIYQKMRKHRSMLGTTLFRLVDYVEAEQ